MELLTGTVKYVLGTLWHNAPYLTLGILVAAGMKVYVDPAKMRVYLLQKSRVSIPGSVVFGAFTPF